MVACFCVELLFWDAYLAPNKQVVDGVHNLNFSYFCISGLQYIAALHLLMSALLLCRP